MIRPKYYAKGGIELVEILKAKLSRDQYLGFLKGNVFKYLFRYPYKNGVEDLKKAETYLKWLLEEESTPKRKENNSTSVTNQTEEQEPSPTKAIKPWLEINL